MRYRIRRKKGSRPWKVQRQGQYSGLWTSVDSYKSKRAARRAARDHARS